MQANWRHLFYYTIGFLPSLFFGLRFFIQWIQSEKKKKSHVNSLFWRLSLAGNSLLATHYFVQFQYPFLMIQAGNAYIAWRNLNFLKKDKNTFSLIISLSILTLLLVLVTSLFFIQKQISTIEVRWLEIPVGLSIENREISMLWHVFGIVGGVLFGMRFWIQWWQTEKTNQSTLNKHFWVLSIIGSLTALIYFIRITDWISILNYSCGLVPYTRNLILLKKRASLT